MAIVTYTRFSIQVEQSLNSDYSDPFTNRTLIAALSNTLRTGQFVDFDLTNSTQTIPTVLANVGNTLILLNSDSSATITVSTREHGGGDNESFIIPANGLMVLPGISLADTTLVSSAAASKAVGFICSPVDSST